jgi:hypothetical protein
MSKDLWQALSPLLNCFMVFIFPLLSTWVAWGQGHHYWIIFKHKARWPPKRFFIHPNPLSSTLGNHCVNPQLCLSILSKQYPHHEPYEWDCPYFGPPLTQLALVKLRVKMLKCKLWSPSKISTSINIPQSYTLVRNGLCILSVLMSS